MYGFFVDFEMFNINFELEILEISFIIPIKRCTDFSIIFGGLDLKKKKKT